MKAPSLNEVFVGESDDEKGKVIQFPSSRKEPVPSPKGKSGVTVGDILRQKENEPPSKKKTPWADIVQKYVVGGHYGKTVPASAPWRKTTRKIEELADDLDIFCPNEPAARKAFEDFCKAISGD